MCQYESVLFIRHTGLKVNVNHDDESHGVSNARYEQGV